MMADLSSPSRRTVRRVLRDQRQQRDPTDHREAGAEEKHGGVPDLIPKPSGDKAGHQSERADSRVVPPDATGAKCSGT
jgi:hypothetical protein